MILKNENCELIIEQSIKPAYANAYYTATLVSGTWPNSDDLITICDNKDFSLRASHFGGRVRLLSENQKEVCVYID